MPTQVPGFWGSLNVSHNANSNITVVLRDGNSQISSWEIPPGTNGYDLEVFQSERLSTGTSLLTAVVTYPSGYTGAANFTTTTGFTVSVVNTVDTTTTYNLSIDSGFLNDGNLVWVIVPTPVRTGFWGSLTVRHNANSNITVELRDGNTNLDGPTSITAGAIGYDLEVSESERLSTGASLLTAIVTYPSGYTGGATFTTTTGFTVSVVNTVGTTTTYNLSIDSGFLNDGNLAWAIVPTPVRTGFWGTLNVRHNANSDIIVELKDGNTTLDGPTSIASGATGYDLEVSESERLSTESSSLTAVVTYPSGYTGVETFTTTTGFTVSVVNTVGTTTTYNLSIDSGFLNDGNLVWEIAPDIYDY